MCSRRAKTWAWSGKGYSSYSHPWTSTEQGTIRTEGSTLPTSLLRLSQVSRSSGSFQTGNPVIGRESGLLKIDVSSDVLNKFDPHKTYNFLISNFRGNYTTPDPAKLHLRTFLFYRLVHQTGTAESIMNAMSKSSKGIAVTAVIHIFLLE